MKRWQKWSCWVLSHRKYFICCFEMGRRERRCRNLWVRRANLCCPQAPLPAPGLGAAASPLWASSSSMGRLWGSSASWGRWGWKLLLCRKRWLIRCWVLLFPEHWYLMLLEKNERLCRRGGCLAKKSGADESTPGCSLCSASGARQM